MFNSRIYESQIEHTRLRPKVNTFEYKIYIFYLDLDEIKNLHRISKLMAYERLSLFSFFEKDHLKFTTNKEKLSIKNRVKQYLKENGIDFVPTKIYLLSQLRLFNYIFNPVSLYYCYDANNQLKLVLVEVNNTYLEQKAYIVRVDKSEDQLQTKNFYVSPFIQHNCNFQFNLPNPGNEKIFVEINSRDKKTSEVILSARLYGKALTLTTKNLIKLNLKYPLITSKIIVSIHWQALKLFFKKISYFNKKDTDLKIRQIQEK